MGEFTPADWLASERSMQFNLGWFANPIFADGDYPEVMREMIETKSSNGSRLPSITADEIFDFKGMVFLRCANLSYRFTIDHHVTVDMHA